jgi:hypothetical protein
MAKVLYIAGYGRSGSTVLSVILGNHPEITSVGEVSFLLQNWNDSDRLCSCGAHYGGCRFWRDFPLYSLTTESAVVRKVEKLSSIPHVLLGLIPDKDRQIYQDYHDRLFDYVVSRTGSSIIVDSSKSARRAAGRFLALSRVADQDVYVLHLVRDGLAVMESRVVAGSNLALQGYSHNPRSPGLRAALGWVGANAYTAALGRLLGLNRYMLLRYEDFVAGPATALKTIGQFVGFDAEALIERIYRDDYFWVGHIVGGNRVRLQGKIKLQRSAGRDHGYSLRFHQRLMFACVGGWLHRFYGYGQ